MSIFRSPAVALMPDVTIKPLRSKGNAIINLMGTFGGILVLGLGIVFATGSVKNSLMSYTVFFSIIAGIMLLCLLIFRLKVDEPRFVKEMEEESAKYGIDAGSEDDRSGSRKLSSAEFRSLILILASVVFWFMGYNAVTSKYSVWSRWAACSPSAAVSLTSRWKASWSSAAWPASWRPNSFHSPPLSTLSSPS